MDTQTQKDRLAADMKLVMNDVEALLRSTANQANGEMEEWHARLRDRVSDMKHRLGELERSAADKARAAGRAIGNTHHKIGPNLEARAARFGLVHAVQAGSNSLGAVGTKPPVTPARAAPAGVARCAAYQRDN